MVAQIGAVILAAGKGTRMKSAQAKVLHQIFYRPMLHHVLAAAQDAAAERMVVVVGHQQEAVEDILADFSVQTVVQAQQRGTGHAVLCAEPACADMEQILILCGDTPLVQAETLAAMLAQHHEQQPALTVMTTMLDNPFGYGRIVDGPGGMVKAIVEEKDATAQQRQIREINAGIYVAQSAFLFAALQQVGTDNSQGEVYLTDIVAIAHRQGKRVQRFLHQQAQDLLGVNSRIELAQAEGFLQQRRNNALMLAGVTMVSPATTRVAPDCRLGRDCVLHGQVCIEEASSLGQGCVVEQGVVLRGCRLGAGVHVGANSVLVGQSIVEGTRIEPLSRLL